MVQWRTLPWTPQYCGACTLCLAPPDTAIRWTGGNRLRPSITSGAGAPSRMWWALVGSSRAAPWGRDSPSQEEAGGGQVRTTFHTVHTVHLVHTLHTVHTVYMVHTVHTVHIVHIPNTPNYPLIIPIYLLITSNYLLITPYYHPITLMASPPTWVWSQHSTNVVYSAPMLASEVM